MKYNGKVKVEQIEFMLDEVYKIRVKRPKDLNIKSGQFFMIKNTGNYPLLNRPISVSKYDNHYIEFGIKKVGIETRNISELKKNDELYLLGPLGNGFDIKKDYKKILLIGGGIGVEPLKAAAMELKEEGIKVKMVLGFRDKAFDLNDFKDFSDELVVYSEKENFGDFQGYPTDGLDRILNEENYDCVFTCGPEILMKKVNEITKKYNLETQLLLEEKMACGIGACLGCTCETKDGYKKVCNDGPMFYGNEVMFNE